MLCAVAVLIAQVSARSLNLKPVESHYKVTISLFSEHIRFRMRVLSRSEIVSVPTSLYVSEHTSNCKMGTVQGWNECPRIAEEYKFIYLHRSATLSFVMRNRAMYCLSSKWGLI
jgi:hypothetical protein